MKKKILAVLLVLCAVVLFALTASAATDTSVGYRVNVTLSADSYFCGTEGHTGEVTSISIKNVDSSKWDTSETRPLTVLFEVSFKCNTCGVSGTKIANNALSLTFRDADSCHAPFNASVTARKLLTGRDDSITFTLTRDKIGYAEKIDKKDATCTESGISQTCWECQGCKQIFLDENCTTKFADDISYVTIPASGHSMTHYEAQDANCQQDGWVEHWKCETCNSYFLDADGLNPTTSSSVMRYDKNKHVGEMVYESYDLDKSYHKVYPSCHPDTFTTEAHVPGDSSKGEDPLRCTLCGQTAAAKVLYSVSPYEKVFFSHAEAVADFNSSETSTEINFLSTLYGTVSIEKTGTVRMAEGVTIQVVNVGDCDVTIWNDGEITNLNAYSSTTLRGSKTGTYGKITNRTEGGTVGDLLFRVNNNSAYYVTEKLQWISRAAASGSSISEVQVLYSPFTYIEITGDGVKEATDEADKYTLTAIRGDTVTLDVATYAVFPSMSADSSITWDYGGIPEDRVSVVRNVDWKDLRLTITDLPSGTYTLTFTRTAVNKFSVSSVLVLTVEETRTAHTVTFDPNGGTLNEDEKSKSVMPGAAYGALPTPTRDSHHFSGWYTAPVGGTKVDETTVVTELEDHTLYAHWTYYHEHCVCGGTLNHTHENVEWQAWAGKSEIKYEQKWVQVSEYTKQGRYVAYVYLTGNVSANLTVAPKHILYLCLNGYSFTCADPSQPAITLTGEDGKPAELDLCDCVGTGTLGGSNASGGSIRIGAYANATLYSGTLTGNNVSGDGGAVSVTGGNCSFTMYGGAITGNTATGNGGGISSYDSWNAGTVKINGGVISNNRATNGGGIYAASRTHFHLNGGEIINNTATGDGGGVYCSGLYSNADGRCEFNGSTISGNTAKQGGGAYVRVCYIGYRNCRITGNTAAEAGGGLYLVPFASEKIIYMGSVYGSGGAIAPYIYDNTVNSAQNNLYLSDPDTQIQFTAHMNTDADAKIGVYFTGITQNGASVLLNSLQINSESRAKPYLDRIFCDNPEYGQLEIQQDGEYYNLYLRSTISAVKVTLDPNGGTLNAGEESKLVQPDSPYGSLPTPTRADYRFDGWFTEKDGGTKVEETTIMSSRAAHTLYAHWTFLHEHCICGGDTAAGDHTAHTAQTFTAWNGTDAISYTNKTAYVYLSQNVTINSNLVVDGTTLYLCLSGNTFASNGTNKIIVKNGGRLVLCDCAGGGTIKGATKSVWGGSCVYLYQSTLDIFGGTITGGKVTGKGGGAIALDDSKCVLNIYGGEISGNNGNKSGGAIFLNKTDNKGGTVNMYGGTIANNTAQKGGVIYSECGGTINLAGGTISGNKATNGDGGVINMAGGTVTISGAKLTGNTSSQYGGAVYLYNGVTATMTGGEISSNQAASEGGAVHVYGTSTFNLSGGKITGNSSVDGGAIYLNREPSVLNMSGGVISGNTATGNGGGVYIYRSGSICNLSGGTIENNTAGSGGGIYVNPKNSGQLKLSGAPTVRNNTVSGAANNVYLPSGKTLSISASMEPGASVGVTVGNASYPVAFSNAYEEDYAAYFSSDDANAQVAYKSDQILYLVTADSRTVLKRTMSSDNTKVEKYYDGTTEFPAANFSPSYTGGGFTYNFKDGNNCTISAVFDSPEAGDSKTVTVTVTLTGENAEQFVFENGTTTDTFTIGGTIHKAEPDLELSMLKTEFLKGDSLYETLSVTGVMENAEVTYRYAEHPSLIYADNDSNNEVIYSFTQAVDAGEFWAYATTAETANYRAGRSNAVKFTVLDFCTVHFESNGALMPRKVPWGRAYGELPVLSREGYTFDGWFTEAEGGTQIQATDIMPENTEEQTLYAHWTPLHTHVFDQQVQNDETLKTPADCLNDAVYYLSCECGEISTSDTFSAADTALGHDWGAWTSSENGQHQRTCSRDSSHVEKEACSYSSEWKQDRYNHWHVCEICGAAQEKAGHFDSDNDHKCDACGAKTSEHDPSAEKADDKYLKSAATCTAKAVYYKSCAICGEKGTETFEYGNPLGHDYGAWTSNDNGTHTRVCSRDANHTETDDCHGGTASCTKKAVCEDCKAEYGNLLPHDFTAETAEEKYLKSAATCTEKAVYYKSCTVCGEKGTETFEYGNPLGHDYGAWTSNDNGTHTRVCSRDAIHTETENCSGGEATCTEQATCEFCGKKYGEPLGHTYKPEWITNEQRHWHVCARCDHIKDMGVHRFGEWSIVRRPTSTKTGERVRSCTICNYEETEELPVTGGYVLPYYKLTFETNGGSSLEPVVKIKGTVIDLAEYSAYRYGYTFDGWYADEALTQRVTSVTLDADKTVYAAWTRNRFFEDVTIADWFYDDVMFVCGRGVMQGVSDTRFGPHLTATRAMMATILWRMEGSPAPTAEARFTDVRSGQWYSEAVAWTAQSGVYTGYADGSFRPNDSITREQLAAILYRYAKYKGVDVSVGEDTNILSYADAAEISDYAFPAMQWACGAGVMQGSNGNLLPRGRATRAQIAAMLHRYLVK